MKIYIPVKGRFDSAKGEFVERVDGLDIHLTLGEVMAMKNRRHKIWKSLFEVVVAVPSEEKEVKGD